MYTSNGYNLLYMYKYFNERFIILTLLYMYIAHVQKQRLYLYFILYMYIYENMIFWK